jgi:demethylmenaquinone methyltransferase/2-methoxy-6-polyprenyl-1,4-benzoquinol methylase/phosphoethanolamine N-methyltransferase
MSPLHNHTHALPSQPPATTGQLIRWAKYYDPCVSLLMAGRRARLRKTTVDLAQIAAGATVLEVGCGTGDVALAAKARAGERGAVYGIDPAPEMIAVAREKAARQGRRVDFQIGVIEALAFPDASFDVVLSSLMMHHLPDTLKPRGLAEIARVLKPGGRLLIVDMKRPSSHVGQVLSMLTGHHAVRTGVDDLTPLLEAAGFTDIELGETGFRALGFARCRAQV